MNAPASNAVSTSIHAPRSMALNHGKETAATPVRAIWMMLKITFSIVPIVAGLDKFTNLLTEWDKYLNPALGQLLPFSPHVFMGIVGVIEIAAGILVFYRPRLGGFVVAAWLASIALSLLASGHFLDVAVRDLVMAVSAFALASLTHVISESQRSKS